MFHLLSVLDEVIRPVHSTEHAFSSSTSSSSMEELYLEEAQSGSLMCPTIRRLAEHLSALFLARSSV